VVSDATISTLSDLPPGVAAVVKTSCRQLPLPLLVMVLERTTEPPLTSRTRSFTERPEGARTHAEAV
jgi:hypothetical protein